MGEKQNGEETGGVRRAGWLQPAQMSLKGGQH